MHETLHDLIRHKWYANALLLSAIHEHHTAAHDKDLRKLLHHILMANRYWLLLILKSDFVEAEELPVPETLDQLVARYKQTERDEMDYLSQFSKADADRLLQSPFLPGSSFTVDQAMAQACMHSQGHRSQCATMLRKLGGTPPPMDFIVWLKDRPAPAWPERTS